LSWETAAKALAKMARVYFTQNKIKNIIHFVRK